MNGNRFIRECELAARHARRAGQLLTDAMQARGVKTITVAETFSLPAEVIEQWQRGHRVVSPHHARLLAQTLRRRKKA